MLLLVLVFRSVLVPIKAALGFLLTVGATFGITVLVFQQGHLAGLVGVDTPGPLVSFLPILLIGILFGLAMDYEVFLVSRMREDFVHGDTARAGHRQRHGPRRPGGHRGRAHHDSVFAGFMLLDDPIIKSMGFALAIGVVDRRLRRPDDDRAGGHVAARPGGLVAAALAGPGPAQRGHRGRGAARAPGGADPHEGLTPIRSIKELWCLPCPTSGRWSGTTTP